jgi:membrane protease YdiL (CAAX protease family)
MPIHESLDTRVRPALQVLAFLLAFVVLSLLLAWPLAAMSGRKTVGIWYILPFTLIFTYAWQRWIQKEEFSKLGVQFGWEMLREVGLGLGLAGLLAAGFTVALLAAGWVRVLGVATDTVPALGIVVGLALALAHGLGVGLGEELVYRGFMMRRLLLGYGRAVAVVVPAAVFSAAHFQHRMAPLSYLVLFLLGSFCGLLVLRRCVLWSAVGVHCGWDVWNDGVHLYSNGATRLFSLQITPQGRAASLGRTGLLLLFLALAALLVVRAIRSASARPSIESVTL